MNKPKPTLVLAILSFLCWSSVSAQGYVQMPGAKVGEASGLSSDLYRMKPRYYNAELKRFLSPDPIGLQGGLNLYVYGSDNPLAFLDPLGLCDGASLGQGFPSDAYINPVDLNPYDPFGGYHVPVASSAFLAGQNIGNGQYGRAALNLAQSVSESLLVESVGASIGRQIAAKTAPSFFEGASYTPKVLKQMEGGVDEFHSFPESVTAFESAGTVRPLTGGDGVVRQMLEIPGSYGSEGNGVFRFIKNADGAINERLFVPNSP